MAKYLKDILKQAHDTIKGTRPSTTEPAYTGKDPGVDYKPKAGDEADFIAKHSVQKWDEPYGNPNYADKVGYTLDKEKNHGNTHAKAKAANEEVQIDEISKDLAKSYIKKASSQVDDADEYDEKQSKKIDRREAGIRMASMKKNASKSVKVAATEETEVFESKKAEDTKCNMSEAGTWCSMHEMADCSSARPIKELSTDTYHRAAQKAAKRAMGDVQGRSGPIFKKYAGMANKFRAKGMEQEKKERAVKEEVSDAAKKVIGDVAKKHGGKVPFTSTTYKDGKKVVTRGHNDEKGNRVVTSTTNEEVIDEKHLTPAEMKKREEIAQAIHKKTPSMPMAKKMAIATATAKKVAEETIVEMPTVKKTPVTVVTSKKIKRNILTKSDVLGEDLAVPLLGGDGDDESAEMAKAELKAIANQAMNLVMQIPDTMIIEPWVQSKIAQAKVMISGVHDYMIYGDHDKDKENEGTMDTPMTFPNMSVDVNTGQNV